MRIVAGRFRGRRLVAPAGDETRPTSDRVREALFQRLGPLDDAQVLDLFAGSGALGLEALSRGAAHATLVDSAPAALRAIEANVAALGLAAEQVEVRRQDARAFLRGARVALREYDLVLLDPPYRLAAALGRELSPLLRAVLAPAARVVSESDRRDSLQLDLPLTDERRYGDTLIRTHERTE
jgi:16S rRNA (guanine966-N2)-methyltransferase